MFQEADTSPERFIVADLLLLYARRGGAACALSAVSACSSLAFGQAPSLAGQWSWGAGGGNRFSLRLTLVEPQLSRVRIACLVVLPAFAYFATLPITVQLGLKADGSKMPGAPSAQTYRAVFILLITVKNEPAPKMAKASAKIRSLV